MHTPWSTAVERVETPSKKRCSTAPGLPGFGLGTCQGPGIHYVKTRSGSIPMRDSPQLLKLQACSFFLGVMLGPILQFAFSMSNGGQIVTLAAGGTASIFLVLSAVATTSKRDFSFMGKFLVIGLVLLILASLVNLFFQVPAASLAISAIAVLIFSGFILFDVNRIVRGGETNYIMATLALYMNIYNLFVNLLHLLLAFMGNRD